MSTDGAGPFSLGSRDLSPIRKKKKNSLETVSETQAASFQGLLFFLFIRDIGTAEEPTGPTGLALPIANRAFPFFQLLL